MCLFINQIKWEFKSYQTTQCAEKDGGNEKSSLHVQLTKWFKCLTFTRTAKIPCHNKNMKREQKLKKIYKHEKCWSD